VNTETKQTQVAVKAKAKRKYTKRTKPTLAARIRTLRDQGHKASQIAAMIGCDVQAVYNQNYCDRKAQAKKSAKLKAAIAQHVEKLREDHRVAIEQHVENLKDAQTILAAKPKLSFMQRVRVLFTGVV
jgi:DNA-binding transcriptional MerR regulator